VVPSFAMHFFQAHYSSILSFFHKFKENLKAIAMAWCLDNGSVTHKYLVEMRTLVVTHKHAMMCDVNLVVNEA
jgi:hypothetical protein